MKKLFFAIFMFVLCCHAFADNVYLGDGSLMTGEVARWEKGKLFFNPTDSAKTIKVKSDKISKVELSNSTVYIPVLGYWLNANDASFIDSVKTALAKEPNRRNFRDRNLISSLKYYNNGPVIFALANTETNKIISKKDRKPYILICALSSLLGYDYLKEVSNCKKFADRLPAGDEKDLWEDRADGYTIKAVIAGTVFVVSLVCAGSGD